MASSVSDSLSKELPSQAIGCDVVAVERFVNWLNQRGEKGLERLLTLDEKTYCLSAPKLSQQAERIAARIAAKEAVAKLLGVGLNGMGYTEGLNWLEVEVMPAQPKQGPALRFHGKAQHVVEAQSWRHWQLSLAHDGPVAMAMVLAMR